jgi:hypothetical protein
MTSTSKFGLNGSCIDFDFFMRGIDCLICWFAILDWEGWVYGKDSFIVSIDLGVIDMLEELF